MDAATKVRFLAVILGDEEPNEADLAKLRRLYAYELGSDGDFEVVHFRRYKLYGYAVTPNDEAVRQCVRQASEQVAVMVPQGSPYTESATHLKSFIQEGVRFRAFFRRSSPPPVNYKDTPQSLRLTGVLLFNNPESMSGRF